MNNPRITCVLLAYNQEKFIGEAIDSILSQDYTPCEIILSDDCSQDRTFSIIKEKASEYDGPNTVIVNRNKKNLGITGHINKLMKTSTGELIIPAAGDDISEPHRISRIVECWKASGALVFGCNPIIVDEEGNRWLSLFKGPPERRSWRDMLLRRGYLGVFVVAWSKAVFERFGPLPEDTPGEDQIIPFRAALVGKVQIIDEPLVGYRRHNDNISYGAISRINNKQWLANKKNTIDYTFVCYREWGRCLAIAYKEGYLGNHDYDSAIELLHYRQQYIELENRLLTGRFIDRSCALATFTGSVKIMMYTIKTRDFISVIKIVLLGISPYLYATVFQLWNKLLWNKLKR